MDPTIRRPLGRSGVEVTALGLGGATYGSIYREVSERDALDAIDAAWDAGIRYFDTSPWYGRGLSELRTGAGLRYRPREEYVLSSKVGRCFDAARPGSVPDLAPWVAPAPFLHYHDYSYDGIMRSYEQSQLRLGMAWYDIGVIHDLDFWTHTTEDRVQHYLAQLESSGWRALEELRRDGLLKAIGAGINELGMMRRFLAFCEPDFWLVAMPYTLLRQEMLDEEFGICAARGISVVIGAPFQSGILATGAVPGARSDYRPADETTLAKVRRIEAVCARHEVPLAAAALQFVMGHPVVAAVIPGAASGAQVERNVATFRHPIPADLWAELKHEGLLREDAPVPA
jgi:D-threo-aldose 1-dehydrogenase